MLMAALVAAVMPLSTIRAEEMADTTVIEKITLNGKPATPQQKAVAKKMAKQGAQMAAKGLKMLTRNICSEYGEYNIQCNGIGPGYIATPQTAPLRERQPDGSRHPFDSFICAKTPAGRWLDPQELTGPAVFLASEASNAVNGHILYVDGGILAYIGKQPK